MTKPDKELEIHDALETISRSAIFHAGAKYDQARSEATQTLFEELLEVGRQVPGLLVRRSDDRGLVIAFEEGGEFEVLLAERNRYVWAVRRGRGQQQHMLENIRFNGVKGRWESTEPDTYWVPIPGEPHRMRAGAAQVLEDIVPLLRADPIDIP